MRAPRPSGTGGGPTQGEARLAWFLVVENSGQLNAKYLLVSAVKGQIVSHPRDATLQPLERSDPFRLRVVDAQEFVYSPLRVRRLQVGQFGAVLFRE